MKAYKIIWVLIFTLSISSSIQIEAQEIEYIDLVHFTHTDIGFNDHPELMLELHQRYIDIAVDAGIETQNSATPFCWTAEVLEPVYAWWIKADEQKRKNLLTLIENGQFEVTDIPYGVGSALAINEAQTANNWIPEELREKFQIKTAMQNDVNGIGRAIIMNSIDNGCKYLWMGINYGGFGKRLFDRPGAFRWKMPNGKRIFAWQGEPYSKGFDFFEGDPFRYKGQTRAANTSKWIPNPGDFFTATKENVLEAHEHVLAQIEEMQKDGYSYDFIITSFSNQWRKDNDPPFAAVAEFFSLWNEMGLNPRINLTTAGRALEKAEKRVGHIAPEFQGEWIDHWAFMLAAMPREISAARSAARHIKAINSSVWTIPLSNRTEETLDKIQRDLVQFYEHTYGANTSHTEPYGKHNLGQMYSIYNCAYRADAYADWILSQRIRSHLTKNGEGMHVINTSDVDYTGWVEFDIRGFRDKEVNSLINQETGEKYQLYNTYYYDQEHFILDREVERMFKKMFWINNLKANSVIHLMPGAEKIEEQVKEEVGISTDQYGWPETVKWDNNGEIAINNFASFFSVQLQGASTRVDLNKLRFEKDLEKRNRMLDEMLVKQPATIVDPAIVEKTPFSSVYRQKLHHYSIENATRDIEIFNNRKMIRVKYKFDRKSSHIFENYFIKFPVPTNCKQPVTSLGGVNYEPFTDQIPGSNKDFQVIDEWVYYPEDHGGWLWSSPDVMVITFGENNVESLRTDAPDNMNELFAMVYNNKWFVDCIDNVEGTVEFEFYLQWIDKEDESKIADKSGATVSKPKVIINPETMPDEFTYKYLFLNE